MKKIEPMTLLHTPELVCLICAYQKGIFKDMLPLQCLPHTHYEILDNDTVETLRQATVVLEPWLAAYGTARLPQLCACLPHMQDTVSLYCVYAHDMIVLDYLASEYPTLLVHSDVLLFAAKHGSLATLQYLATHGFSFSEDDIFYVLRFAYEFGHFDIV
ncbi:Aste57867_16666 [Aphanomyces stellatus]|uniref:Aste57867_16666 protein n=1 Tax=Aphanomyces stellatus TaxID=120398 RepID=A0A485KDA3_9STRA|nr:hypothetical protein As57867_016609 [Aphanomyces stellatus]KAF0708618.1 hypothetical protein As57867_006272 [Aphanomyces stellatus]KAF0709856.1 hypothetical protein As57867_005716 [Aphanomyces stellatus]VFT82760.1 Aste57867_5729 [Aphanomyces stellatus]VFT83284.1 Aste57867_6286 [Aphanomyces stellatus]